jgi:hypothetical protein
MTMIEATRRAAATTGVTFVETADWFCSDGACPTVIGDYIARRDPTHVSVSYAAYLTDELEQQLQLGDPPTGTGDPGDPGDPGDTGAEVDAAR